MNVRQLLEFAHREAAGLAGQLSLLLVRDKLTKRDVLSAIYRLERLGAIAEKLRAAANIPKSGE